MSENKQENLDVIRLVKEVSRQGIENFELEYGNIKIKMSAGKSKLPNIQSEINLPEASPSQIDDMRAQEQKTIEQRVNERDESLLYDLDYLAPEIAGDLRRANVITVNANGNYEYIVDEERLDA